MDLAVSDLVISCQGPGRTPGPMSGGSTDRVYYGELVPKVQEGEDPDRRVGQLRD